LKKLIKIVFVTLFFFSVTAIGVEAHSGRTDSSGGHNCSQKSINKGLCSGYHYHNGGEESSGGESSEPSYEEIAAQEKSQGQKDGYDQGYTDSYNGGMTKNTITSSGSWDYQEGYAEGYNDGFEKGKEKFESIKEKAKKSGYSLGKKQDKILIPNEFSKISLIESYYVTAFEKGVKERDDNEKKKQEEKGFNDGKQNIKNEPKKVKESYLKSYQEGYVRGVAGYDALKIEAYTKMGITDGKLDQKDVPVDIKESYVQAYEEGFKEGLEELKQTYVKKGHEAAFAMISYKEPKLDKPLYVKWYKEGFVANKKVQKVRDLAFEDGLEGNELSIPKEFSKAKTIYNHYFEKGQEQRAENNMKKSGVFGFIILGWLSRRFYVAKKMMK
jgi:flagellar biosynthesis/type III secretory pathway protein FliH